MKIALIALPCLQASRVTPPLPLCYLAALLEQQRHIVRVYDLALYSGDAKGSDLDAIRTFRPHVIIIAVDDVAHAAAVAEKVQCFGLALPLTLGVRDHLPPWLAARTLTELNRLLPQASEIKSLIACALLALDEPLDTLPLPARHLLPLERYPLITPEGEVQTPVLIGRWQKDNKIAFRQPALLETELRSIVQEHGVRHVILEGLALTDDCEWLYAFVSQIARMHLNIWWEGRVSHTRLTPRLIDMMYRSGCKALTFEFAALSVLDAKHERDALINAVRQAREMGMRVKGHIALDPHYPSIPAVVDMSATFGLDEVHFFVPKHADTFLDVEESVEIAQLITLARNHYRISRSRQYFIDRFGVHLGTMLWHINRTGVFGRRFYHEMHDSENESSSEIAIEPGRG